ncbi:MAG: hypothetical protein M1457_02500 [bacterium]|nr:hypothetical protein [bacterium]
MIRIRIAGMGLSVVARLPLDEPARNEFDLLAKGLLQVARQPLSELAWDQREALEHLARLAEEQARAASPAPALTTLAQPPSGADRIGLSAAPSPVGPINLRPACS